MSRTGHIVPAWLIGLAVLMLLPTAPAAQTEAPAGGEAAAPAFVPDTASADMTFLEITLDENGVRAVDTLGREWRYDFEQDVFVELADGGEGGEFVEVPYPQDRLPIEERATQQRKVAKFERSVIVGYDEYVDGDIVAEGRVTIKGWVRGDVKSLSKRVLVSETGRVDGDIEAPSIIVRPGGSVLGNTTETTSPFELESLRGLISADAIGVMAVLGIVLIFFGFLVVALMPTQLGRITACICKNKVKCYLLGFLFLILKPVVLVLCIITLVGIILVPFIPLVYAAADLLGLVAFGSVIGGLFAARFLGGRKGLQVNTLIGEMLLVLLWVVTFALMSSASGLLQGLGIAALVISIIVTTFPLFTGIGAAILTRFGTRDYETWKQRRPDEGAPPAPAPPPLRAEESSFDSGPYPPPPPPVPPGPRPPTQQS